MHRHIERLEKINVKFDMQNDIYMVLNSLTSSYVSLFRLVICTILRPHWLKFTIYCKKLKQESRSLIPKVLWLPQSWPSNKERVRRKRTIPNFSGKGKPTLESPMGQREIPTSMLLLLWTQRWSCAFIVAKRAIGEEIALSNYKMWKMQKAKWLALLVHNLLKSISFVFQILGSLTEDVVSTFVLRCMG